MSHSKEVACLVWMFNKFQCIFNHLVVNKRNTDSHTVCNTENTLTPTILNTKF